MGATPSQLAPPKGVEGRNLLLPALDSQDSNRRTPESVSPDVNAERATTPSPNRQASMTKRFTEARTAQWNGILITLISIVRLIQRYESDRSADWCAELAKLIGALVQPVQQEGWRGRHRPGRDMCAHAYLRVCEQFRADQPSSWSTGYG